MPGMCDCALLDPVSAWDVGVLDGIVTPNELDTSSFLSPNKGAGSAWLGEGPKLLVLYFTEALKMEVGGVWTEAGGELLGV